MRQLKAYPVGCFIEETLTSLKDAQSIVDCLEAENKRLMEEVGIVVKMSYNKRKGFISCVHCGAVLNAYYLKSVKSVNGGSDVYQCPVCGCSVFMVEGRWGESPKYGE